MENFSNYEFFIILLQFVIIGIYIYREVRDDVVHRAKFIPKYDYDVECVLNEKTPTILLKLILERGDIPYYITNIALVTRLCKKRIISYTIQGKRYDVNNKKMNIHHIIKPLTENNKNDKVELEIQIPFVTKENREVLVGFGYAKYPLKSDITIKLPPNNYTVM